MTPERWLQIKEIFNSAVELAPPERPAFLLRVCDNDEKLRQEIEALIASHERDGSFIDSPAYQAAAATLTSDQELNAGQRVDHYEIISRIGGGGMGEVYLARDTTLGRNIALKFLSSDFTQSSDFLQRFQQEARAASGLNHPNILTIHEIGEADGQQFIATEFIEGKTLRERLADGPLPVAEALNVGEQVASALSAAHEKGIIHRDIKPNNIMLRRDGFVKVLDFGLAKLMSSEAVGSDESTLAMIRTVTGIVMGTPAYMSPEQTRGLIVDSRTDIWSLGAVIYEMLSGKPPFEGETRSDVMASVLDREPAPLGDLVIGLPAELQRIVSKALRKDREERYQVVKDLLLDLKSLKEEIDFEVKLDHSVPPKNGTEATDESNQSKLPTEQPHPETGEIKTAVSTLTHSLSVEIKRHKTGVIFALVALVVVALVGVIAVYKSLNRTRPNGKPEVLKTYQITFSPGLDGFPSFSPDGKSVVYSSDQKGSFEIYIKQLALGGGELQLTNDGQENCHPSWSPDGQQIAYYARNRGGIWLISALGGNPKQLTEFGARPAWSPDGSMIAFQSGTPGEIFASNTMPPSTIWIVPSHGGEPKQISQTGHPSGGHSSPSWSPNGKRIVFENSFYLSPNVWSVAVNGGETKKISHGGNPIYAPDGEHIYFDSGDSGELRRIQVSSSGDPIGDAAVIMRAGPGTIFSSPAISADGTKLIFSATRLLGAPWSVPLSPSSAQSLGPPIPLERDTSQRQTLVRFSPDGRKIAMTKWRPGMGTDIWIADEDGKNLVQVTNNPTADRQANWFPGGDKLAFLSDRTKHLMLWTISLATGKEEPFLDLGEDIQFAQLSPDAKYVAFNSTTNGIMNVWIADTKDGKRRQLTFDDQFMGFPCWSPDSKLIAFEWQKAGNDYLMVIPTIGGQPAQLTFGPGKSWPFSWSPDGDKIAFAGQRDGIWNIYWISRSTKSQKQLTYNSKLNAFLRYPEWSPLGTKIVYEYAETTGNIWVAELK